MITFGKIMINPSYGDNTGGGGGGIKGGYVNGEA